MAAESFWNNREQAQKLIDEATTLRKKTEPLLKRKSSWKISASWWSWAKPSRKRRR